MPMNAPGGVTGLIASKEGLWRTLCFSVKRGKLRYVPVNRKPCCAVLRRVGVVACSLEVDGCSDYLNVQFSAGLKGTLLDVVTPT